MNARAILIALVALGASGFATVGAVAQDVRREHVPGREKVIPHVSGDRYFSNTYDKNWKDEATIRAAIKKGLPSRDINFKDFRWLQKSLDGELAMDEGRELFHKKDAQGRSCAGCHDAGGAKLKGIQAGYPKVHPRTGKVTVIPSQIRICAEERLERKDLHEETRANAMLAFFIGSLSDGHVINIDVTKTGPLKDSYERGKELFFRRTGQFHFACAHCHTSPTAISYIRGQRPSTFFGDASQYPIWHYPFQLPGQDRGFVFTLQHQIKSCQTLSRMYPGKEGSPSFIDIETFLTAVSNGYKISIPTMQYNMQMDYLKERE
jgi:sulfur-oxidizing protein SoxA